MTKPSPVLVLQQQMLGENVLVQGYLAPPIAALDEL